MIKYFCDRCGKEIDGKVNEYTDTTEAINPHTQKVVATWKSVEHMCDECEQRELTCGFKVGDEVITDDGRIGKIIDICTCEHCEERGFYEPEVEFDDGDTEYIEISDKRDGFKSFYKIGNHIFGNIDDNYLLSRIAYLRGELEELELRLNVVRRLKKENN